MVISEWEIEIEDCCIDNFWDGKEYYVSHKYICKNCRRYSPGVFPYLFCPHCGAEMVNGKEMSRSNGTNS